MNASSSRFSSSGALSGARSSRRSAAGSDTNLMSAPITDQNEQFHAKLGYAFEMWSMVETMLCSHFSTLTTMPLERAKAIFYSARSLRGRTDMISAALDVGGSAIGFPTYFPFVKVAVNRTGQWAAFRNKMAHGRVYRAPPGSPLERLGPSYLVDALDDQASPKKPITATDLDVAAMNFSRLATLLVVGDNHPTGLDEPRLQECHALVQLLPTKPDEPETRPKIEERFRQLTLGRNWDFRA